MIRKCGLLWISSRLPTIINRFRVTITIATTKGLGNAHFGRWASPVFSTRTPWALGPRAQGPGPDFKNGFRFSVMCSVVQGSISKMVSASA